VIKCTDAALGILFDRTANLRILCVDGLLGTDRVCLAGDSLGQRAAMILVQALAFVLVFAAVVAAYAFGRRDSGFLRWRRSLRLVRQYSPPINIVLEYRNGAGLKTLWRVRLQKSLHGSDGALYLQALFGTPSRFRTFRVDRILCFATPDGEVLDTQRFLTEQLAIPAEFCPSLRPRSKMTAQARTVRV